MRIILTGATGNLGSALLLSLKKRGHIIIPVIRAENKTLAQERINKLFDEAVAPEVIISDLENIEVKINQVDADCVIHSAGIVNLKADPDRNSRMTRNALTLAETLSVPFFHISSAFLWGSHNGNFRNEYEMSKAKSEEMVIKSKIPWAIFRPSILTGHSETGQIIDLSGYYLVVKAFLRTLTHVPSVTFPRFVGETNLVPLNWAAESMVDLIESNVRGTFYITSHEPFASDWLITKSLEFLGLNDRVSFLDCTLDDYSRIARSDGERRLFEFLKHLTPYWTGPHSFPETQLAQHRKLDESYIKKILTYAQDRDWK